MLPSEPYFITQVEYIAPPKQGDNDYGDGSLSSPKHSGYKKNMQGGSNLGTGGIQGQRTRFTVRELIKIFEVTSANPCKKNKNQVYWQRFIKKGYVFPGRSVNSVNA